MNISRIENGQRATPETAAKLAWALGVGDDELLEDFSEAAVEDEGVRRLYKETYLRLLAAERRAAKGRPELFDAELDDHVLDLVEAVKILPPGVEKARLRGRVRKMARRAAAVFELEAEQEAARRRDDARRLREADRELGDRRGVRKADAIFEDEEVDDT